MSADPFFEELKGEQLSAVTFVQDYIQLQFDGPTINVTNPLEVGTRGRRIASWQPGFRDLLCEQITKIVQGVDLAKGEALRITFEDESYLSVSLRAEDYGVSPEAFYAHGFKNDQWLVE
jgi:hypothetical protein